MVSITKEQADLFTVIGHPAFISLAHQEESGYTLTMEDPVGENWQCTGSLRWCIASAIGELPLEG